MDKVIHRNNYDLITHDDPWREKAGGIECLVCEDKVPYGSKVYNEGGTNDFLCLSCYYSVAV